LQKLNNKKENKKINENTTDYYGYNLSREKREIYNCKLCIKKEEKSQIDT
jgi:hypothetical protein